jgi:hypothetical protein
MEKIIKKFFKNNLQKWSIAYKVIPFVILIGILKLVFHEFGLEFMQLNALFTSLVAGTIFLIGFLISGVLSDYKESEKIPTELSSSMKTLFDDTYTILKGKNSTTAKEFIEFQKLFVGFMMDWLYRKEKTRSMLAKISDMNDFFVKFDNEGIQPNYIIKLKNEQNSIRRMVLRIDTIRDTDFIAPAYAILETMGILISFGLLIINFEIFYAGLFFTLVVTFMIGYMVLLIHDLDNPFDYAATGEQGTEISLKPIRDHQAFLSNNK